MVSESSAPLEELEGQGESARAANARASYNGGSIRINRKGIAMPAYDYQCSGCGCRFEVRQKMSDQAIESCPSCGGTVKRLISGGAGAISKGGSHAGNFSEAGSGCGLGGPCRGQGGGCANREFCEH